MSETHKAPAEELGGTVFEEYSIGDTYETRSRTITESDIRMFLGATGFSTPDHLSHEYVQDQPLWDEDEVSVNGTLLLAVVDSFEAETVGQFAALGAAYGYDRVRYIRPVHPGDTLRAEIEISDKRRRDEEWGVITLDVTALNQEDEVVMDVKQLLIVATADNSILRDQA